MLVEFKNDINQMTNTEFCEMLINDFLKSEERKLMLDGYAYYKVDNIEISNREMKRYEEQIDQYGKVTVHPIKDRAKPNHKRKHGFLHLLVEDKVNYLLSKPYTLSCEKSEEHLEKIKNVLGKKFQEKRIMKLGIVASNGGIGWLHPYINENGEFKTIIIPPEQCIPGWADNDHEEMTDFIWFYSVDVIEGREVKQIIKVEYWTTEGVAYYTSTGKFPALNLILDSERYLDVPEGDGDFTGHFVTNNQNCSWGKVPFIPFKNNDDELPDLQFIKSLVDAYDKGRSDVANYLDEVRNIVYTLKGYGANKLSDFMRDLSYFRAIKLDEDGEASVLTPDIDITAAKEDYDQLRKDIFTFGQGVDKDADKLGNSPSGIALKFMYSGLDLKCNRMENSFKDGFEQLVWFINKYLEITEQGADYEAEIDITFNRDININESQAITDCQNSIGIISDETIMENHPWVKDVEQEKKRLKQEKKEQEEDMNSYKNAFEPGGDGSDNPE